MKIFKNRRAVYAVAAIVAVVVATLAFSFGGDSESELAAAEIRMDRALQEAINKIK